MKARSQPVRSVSFVPPAINTGDPDIDKIHRWCSKAIDRSEGTAPAGGASRGRSQGEGLLPRRLLDGRRVDRQLRRGLRRQQGRATCPRPADGHRPRRSDGASRSRAVRRVGRVAGVSTRVVAVVVTWNRRDLLQESLAALAAQTFPPSRVVVVDNASDRRHRGAAPPTPLERATTSSRLTANTGGAGGFTAGIERALTHEPDLVWLLDDDTVPTPTAAAELVRAWTVLLRGRSRPARAGQPGGLDRRSGPPDEHPATQAGRLAARSGRPRRAIGCVPVRSASFVSIMCDARVVRERGLPVADYFLWNDDFEYSTRLIRGRRRAVCPGQRRGAQDQGVRLHRRRPGGAVLLEVRNKVWMFTRSRSLAPREKALYGAADRSPLGPHVPRLRDRATLRRGLRSGLARRPAQRSARQRRRCSRRQAGSPRTPAAPPGPCRPGSRSRCWSPPTPGTTRASCARPSAARVHGQTRRPDEVVLVQDGPVPARARRRDRPARRGQPGAGPARRHRCQPRARPGARPRPGRLQPRDRRPDGRRRRQPPRADSRSSCRSSRRAPTSSARACWSSATSVRRRGRAPYAADRPRRDPPGDPLPRPVQPPDRRLPQGGRPGSRRLHRHGADGGLPPLHPDGRRWRPAGQPRRAAGAATGWGRAPTPDGAAPGCCAPSSRSSAGSVTSGITAGLSTSATSWCAADTGSCRRQCAGSPTGL